jgi:hypothetical protein
LDLEANPFFREAFMAGFQADDGSRLAAVLDVRLGGGLAFFGWLKKSDAASLPGLLEEAAGWARSRGAKRLLGPLEPGWGGQVGADADLSDTLAALGFRPAGGFSDWRLDLATQAIPENLLALAAKAKETGKVTFSPLVTSSAHELAFLETCVAEEADPLSYPDFQGKVVEKPVVRLGRLAGELASYSVLLRDPVPGWQGKLGAFFPSRSGSLVQLGTSKAYREFELDDVTLVDALQAAFRSGISTIRFPALPDQNSSFLQRVQDLGAARIKSTRLYERGL